MPSFPSTEQSVAVKDGGNDPKTFASPKFEAWRSSVDKYLIVNGQRVQVSFPVVTFEHPEGLSFYGRGGWGMRDDPTGRSVDLVVLHWDECISSHDCFNTLLKRHLSAHLLVDYDGTVYQTLDLAEARGWHARQANERSIGIEIQNPVYPAKQPAWQPPRPLISETLPHTIQEWSHLDFTHAPKEVLSKLVLKLCEIFNIPRRLPRDDDGGVPTGLIDPRFAGVCGHYHLQTDKVDPGLTLWSILGEEGRTD